MPGPPHFSAHAVSRCAPSSISRPPPLSLSLTSCVRVVLRGVRARSCMLSWLVGCVLECASLVCGVPRVAGRQGVVHPPPRAGQGTHSAERAESSQPEGAEAAGGEGAEGDGTAAGSHRTGRTAVDTAAHSLDSRSASHSSARNPTAADAVTLLAVHSITPPTTLAQLPNRRPGSFVLPGTAMG